jgi:hypothetical protein
MISAKRLAVVMPAYNAANTLVQTVTELPEIVLGGGLRVRKIAQELEPMGGTLTSYPHSPSPGCSPRFSRDLLLTIDRLVGHERACSERR